MDMDVSLEVADCSSSNRRSEDFVLLSAKAVASYSHRVDYIIKEKGFDDLYEKYLTWRNLVVAVQEIKQGQAEIKKLEEGLEALRKEKAEILDWAEREGGPEARQRLENSVLKRSDPE